MIFGSTLLIIIFSIIGILKLEVENSFINYFDKETEIYKGMKKIDDDLGGTTPLNIILKFPVKKKEVKQENDEFDEWEEENEKEEFKNLKTTLLLDPKNEEAMYLLIDIELERSNFSKAEQLREDFKKICSNLCDKIASINKRLKEFEKQDAS